MWLSEKLGNYIVNCEQLLITISEGRVNLKHTISQRNAQAIQDLLVGIYFLVHSRTYVGFHMGTGKPAVPTLRVAWVWVQYRIWYT